MRTFLKCVLAISSLGLTVSYAAISLPSLDSLSNTICQTMKIQSQDKNIFLNTSGAEGSLIYFVKNASEKSIWLDHPVKNASASAGWSSYLRPGNWSAILVDKKSFELSCALIQPGKVDSLNCSQSLSICNPSHVIFMSNRKGSYWLTEDKSWKEFIKALVKRGVKINV